MNAHGVFNTSMLERWYQAGVSKNGVDKVMEEIDSVRSVTENGSKNKLHSIYVHLIPKTIFGLIIGKYSHKIFRIGKNCV